MNSLTIYIYALLDPRDESVKYVGRSYYPDERLKQHIGEAESGGKSHKCRWIRRLLKKDFTPIVKILQECNEDSWREAEVNWISEFDNLTNQTEGGYGILGYRHSKEAIEKIRQASIGRVMSDETRAKRSILMKGHAINPKGSHLSEQHRKRIGDANRGSRNGMYGKLGSMKGKKHTEEARRKMSLSTKGQIAWNRGIPHTEKHKENLKKNHVGFIDRVHSEETKKKMSEGKVGENNPMYGKFLSDNHKQKISTANRGRKRSEKTKERMRKAWIKRKAQHG